MKKSNSIVCTSFAPDSHHASTVSRAAEFGWSVDINCDGSRVLVGSGNDPSAVYLFDRDGKIIRTFHNPHHGINTEHDGLMSRFGMSVKMNINGQRILIADPVFSVVYLYDNLGHLIHTFTPPNDSTNAIFGTALAISDDGTKIVIGAEGVVYLYYQDSRQKRHHRQSTWEMATQICNTRKAVADGGFGVSVALSPNGSFLLVGAWKEREEKGAAYLYRIIQNQITRRLKNGKYMEGTPTFTADLAFIFYDPEPIHARWFGHAVDLTDNYAVIGAHGDVRDHKRAVGAVYVFSMQEEYDEDTYLSIYRLVDTISVAIPTEDTEFGAAVSASGDRILIASYGDGSAYWYEKSSDTNLAAAQTNYTYFKLQSKVPVPTLSSTTTSTRFFGAAVALSRNGKAGVVGVPRTLGKSGYMTTGSALGLCLPEPGADTATVNYSCPALELPAVSWTDVQEFWLSWDSDSGKILALIGTLIVSLFILCYGSKRRQHRRHHGHRFQRLSTTQSRQDFELELQVIQEESEIL